MKRKLPTILILLVMVLVGAMYWVDLSYYTDPQTGFITRGSVWVRYAVLALPLVMCLLGLRTVGPKAISVLRVQNPGLGWLFCVVAAVGVAFGGACVVFGLGQQPVSVYRVVLGVLCLWYGVWVFLVGRQLFSQQMPSPTKSALFGIVAALPFAMTTVYRIMVRPSSPHRVGPLVRAMAALFAMLWFGFLLRALYIALPRGRVRWMYLSGVFTFLFATCLEPFYTLHLLLRGHAGSMDLFESLFMASFGLVAGCVSVAIAARSEAAPPPVEEGEDEGV